MGSNSSISRFSDSTICPSSSFDGDGVASAGCSDPDSWPASGVSSDSSDYCGPGSYSGSPWSDCD